MTFDEILTLLEEDLECFKEKAESNPALLDVRWGDGETLVQFLITERKYDQVIVLAELGASVNTRKTSGGTPLHSAISGNDLEGIRLLIELGADTSIFNKAGFDAVEWADFLDVDKEIKSFLERNDQQKSVIERCDWTDDQS